MSLFKRKEVKPAKTKKAKTVAKPAAPKKKTAAPKKTSKSGTSKRTMVFRNYKKEEGSNEKKVKHPKLIVEETEKTNKFMGLTSSAKKGHHQNIALSENPQKGESKNAYIRKEIREDKKENFGEILRNYKLSSKDKKKIIEYLENRKKKK